MLPGRARSVSVSLLAAMLIAIGTFLTSGSATAVVAGGVGVRASAIADSAVSGAPFAVRVRHYSFSRGPDRPLPTTVWYPMGAPSTSRFPLIIWSHGLSSSPVFAARAIAWLAAHGFVIAAPTFPHTNQSVHRIDRGDVPNQSVDASFVLTCLLDQHDDLTARIDPGRIAAVGHSAGGTTTNGLLAAHRDPRIKAAIVLAGRPMGTFTGPPTPVLFVHGDKDPVVAYDQGRAAYQRVPWPKAFLTIVGGNHGTGLDVGARGHAQVMATMLDFLRWTLDADQAAKQRLAADATQPGATRFEEQAI